MMNNRNTPEVYDAEGCSKGCSEGFIAIILIILLIVIGLLFTTFHSKNNTAMTEFDIVSYGESVKYHEKKDGIITIGVNHVEMVTNIDWLLLLDNPMFFSDEKMFIVKNTKARKVIVKIRDWEEHLPGKQLIQIDLAAHRADFSGLFEESLTNVPYSYNSPLTAACIAIKLGAKRVNLYGVDFVNDSAVSLDFHYENIVHFDILYDLCKSNGIQMFTTPESKLSEFIPVNPDLL